MKFSTVLAAAGYLILLVIAVMSTNETRNLKSQVAQKVTTLDSLRDEDFIKSTIIGRYELTLEHLKETNPKAAKDFEDYLNHETE
jgi:hypothetical protein